MRTAKKDSPASAPGAPAAEKKEATKGDALRGSLRGKDFAEQEQALKPEGGDTKKPVAAAKSPSNAGLGKGDFHMFVEGQNAHFFQRVTLEGAKAALPTEAAPPVGQAVPVKADGPWKIKVEHKVPEGTTWAKDHPKGWTPSDHQEVGRGADFLDVATEDFKDNDFNDLVLSVVRDVGAGGGEDGEAYLVESETKVDGMATSYDLVLGASSSGRLDVILNYRVIAPDELAQVDKDALAAMSERFASLKAGVASSIDHAEKRKQVEAEIAVWERALQEARAKAEAAPTPDAKRAAPKA